MSTIVSFYHEAAVSHMAKCHLSGILDSKERNETTERTSMLVDSWRNHFLEGENISVDILGELTLLLAAICS